MCVDSRSGPIHRNALNGSVGIVRKDKSVIPVCVSYGLALTNASTDKICERNAVVIVSDSNGTLWECRKCHLMPKTPESSPVII